MPIQKITPRPDLRWVFFCCLLLLGCRLAACGQASSARLRVVVLKSSDLPFYNPAVQGLTNGLKTRGFKNGDKIELKVLALSGKSEADIALVKEQLQKKPSLLVTLGTDATRLAAEQKPACPVLFSMILDPVSLGVAKSLEAPGGNFTGTTLLIPPGKQLDALLQVIPKLRRIGVLYTEKDATSLALLDEARQDAKRLDIEILAIPVGPSAKTADMLAGIQEKPDAFWLIPDPASTGPQALAETLKYAQKQHLPVLGASGGTVRAGALLALSASLEDLGDVTADMAARILNGTESPASMRVRGPRRTLLIISLLAARPLGITIPPNVLQLADEVVDTAKDENEP